ncbi:TM2 domain-containing protein [Acinetobacter sp. 194]|nr:TM2 domain-containing protein [Acinetobacter shaoyimingii]
MDGTGQASEIYGVAGAAAFPGQVGEKNRIVAAILAFFLGGFGVHKFYLGRIGWGVLYLLFFWTFIPSIVAFVEFIIYLCTSDEDFARKYG